MKAMSPLTPVILTSHSALRIASGVGLAGVLMRRDDREDAVVAAEAFGQAGEFQPFFVPLVHKGPGELGILRGLREPGREEQEVEEPLAAVSGLAISWSGKRAAGRDDAGRHRWSMAWLRTSVVCSTPVVTKMVSLSDALSAVSCAERSVRIRVHRLAPADLRCPCGQRLRELLGGTEAEIVVRRQEADLPDGELA